MRYVSTRGEAPPLPFSEAMLAGLARDGGLYVPEAWPSLSRDEIAGMAGSSYVETAARVLAPLTGLDPARKSWRAILEEAYGAFRSEAVCPLRQLGPNLFVLELFHGPTLAFKDVAMRLLAGLMGAELRRQRRRATIVGATSGDTGSAAIDAFRGVPEVDVFILYPHGRVSEVQRRQMTTAGEDNVHAVAVDGTFDDCQALVKALFNHHTFRDELALTGVNSINWARVAAQTVYYFAAAAALGAPGREVAFTVPTGNFGNVLAGSVARKMGLPLAGLTIATNANDILARALDGGAYEVTGVVQTTSPSMDIQVSSNFERALFEAWRRDAATLRGAMERLKQAGRFTIEPDALQALRREYGWGTASETDVAATIRDVWNRDGVLVDPHTAVAIHVARERLADDPATPQVVLGTAHPAKFPDAVEAATGIRPQLPPALADLMTRTETITRIPNDQGALERLVRERARVLTGAAA